LRYPNVIFFTFPDFFLTIRELIELI
jgi:hypothetical protein